MTRIEILTSVGIVVAVLSGIVMPLLLHFLSGRGAERKPLSTESQIGPEEPDGRDRKRGSSAYWAELHAIESPGFYFTMALLSPLTGVLNGRRFMRSDFVCARKTGRYSFVLGLVGIGLIGLSVGLYIVLGSLWALLGGVIAYFGAWYVTALVIFYNAFCNNGYHESRGRDLRAMQAVTKPKGARSSEPTRATNGDVSGNTQ